MGSVYIGSIRVYAASPKWAYPPEGRAGKGEAREAGEARPRHRSVSSVHAALGAREKQTVNWKDWKVWSIGVAALMAVTIVAACGGSASPPGVIRSKHINAYHYGERWPLTVEKAELICQNAHNPAGDGLILTRVFVKARGETYAVNGLARDLIESDPTIHDIYSGNIWRSHSTIPGLRIDIGPLIDEGLKLCGAR